MYVYWQYSFSPFSEFWYRVWLPYSFYWLPYINTEEVQKQIDLIRGKAWPTT